MNIETFLLCDAATDSQGKLNILGAFDVIYSKLIPVIHPQCAVALRLRLKRAEQGKHTFNVHFIGADGKYIIPQLDGDFDIKINDERDSSGAVNIILNVQGVKLEQFGEYAISLFIDGKEVTSLPFFVKQAIS